MFENRLIPKPPKVHQVTDLTDHLDEVPPPGMKHECYPGGFRIECSSRLWGDGLVAAAVWNGMFLTGMIGTQIRHENFLWVLWLMATPFFLMGRLLVWFALLLFFGRTTFELEADQLRIFVGLVWIGRQKTIDWAEINQIEDRPLDADRPNRHRTIHLDDFACHVFAMPPLPESRRLHALRLLKQHLSQSSNSR